jgi:hypothetical protein
VNEGNNLQGFIDNPSEHVNYNPYLIMDFTKLTGRLSMLRDIENGLKIITEYKKGSENYTRSMYESALDGIPVQLIERLYHWLQKRYADMSALISSASKVDESLPLNDYVGMYTFNQVAFMQEFGMYKQAIQGCEVLVQYKLENTQNVVTEPIITTNEPPTDTGA